MTDRPAPATLRDVAALAGVSYQTVSRALNRPAAVRPQTLARIERAIEDLQFQPNVIARDLRNAGWERQRAADP